MNNVGFKGFNFLSDQFRANRIIQQPKSINTFVPEAAYHRIIKNDFVYDVTIAAKKFMFGIEYAILSTCQFVFVMY
jgi:hypothetical protein